MQNAQSTNPTVILENVLLTRSERKGKAKVDNLISQAQRKAKEIVAQSEKQAEKIQRQACMAGYERGLLSAADAVCSYLAAAEKLAGELSKRNKQEIHAFLSAFFTDEKTVLALLDNWLVTSVNKEYMPVQILMPDSCRLFHQSILELIENQRSKKAVIAYHKGAEFIFKCQGKIVSFNPEVLIDTQKEKRIAFKELINECSEISVNTLKEFSETIGFYLRESKKNACGITEKSEGDNDDDNRRI